MLIYDKGGILLHWQVLDMVVLNMQDLVSAFEDRGLKIGKAMFRELTGLKKPYLDKSNILHWPVLMLYPEVMSGDIIEDFCETDMFSIHLDTISFILLFSYQVCFNIVLLLFWRCRCTV